MVSHMLSHARAGNMGPIKAGIDLTASCNTCKCHMLSKRQIYTSVLPLAMCPQHPYCAACLPRWRSSAVLFLDTGNNFLNTCLQVGHLHTLLYTFIV